MDAQVESQYRSGGGSTDEIHRAAIAQAHPAPGLSWIDIGCGSGDVFTDLRPTSPSELVGVDILDWLAPGNEDVDLHVGPAESVLSDVGAADRVLLIETMEHLESPWTVLRLAADLVAPGGRIVVTTPNVASVRHRAELLARGTLTSFREDHPPHLSPILPHVTSRILREAGLVVESPFYAGPDVLPKTGGRTWPDLLVRRFPLLTTVSVGVAAERPVGA